MLLHIPTGYIFKNRLEAKRVMGSGRYNRLNRKREFRSIITDNLIILPSEIE